MYPFGILLYDSLHKNAFFWGKLYRLCPDMESIQQVVITVRNGAVPTLEIHESRVSRF